MPCNVDTDDSPEGLLQQEAVRLRIKLLELRGEFVPPGLKQMASGYFYVRDAVPTLCRKIRELGGTEYMETLREVLPKNPDVYEIYSWWLRHHEADAKREEQINAARPRVQEVS